MRYLKNVGLGVAGVLMLAAGLVVAGVGPALGTEKITICHAAGQEGTLQYVTLSLPHQAVFGQGGHFNENGTPQAGHENDYMGPCETTPTETEPPPTETEPPPTTTEPPPTTTEEEPPPTTTTPGPPCPNNPGGQEPNPPGGQDGKPGNDRCIPDPTPTATISTPTPPVVTTAATPSAPPVTTTDVSSTPPVSAPLTQKKAKAKRTPAASDPPVSAVKTAVKTAHVCKTLADGTERKWFKGGNGLEPGCYPVARGSY